ncbi:hypothetical protein K450DRAFT_239582 [Umbelopsis ramanniana AG]|uniref:Uncharacterized protein n=1 Tax=Umbelopsis ramanniana AG TaxID=1314678 RepID=A0AAD5EBK0_UMBRA|nr:uncharacterized protein K450DRAFT_239582 [Umbelopsis ramanniana AG]KAI8579890.1 hypothetical protein K450DRAFT_239582 [Umbelopsis ramanniana AG]
MSSETSRPTTPARGSIILQRDFHGRLMLCDNIQNNLITVEDWIAHERTRIGQNVQPRHCEDYEVLAQIIDDVFHFQQQSNDNWNMDNPPRIRSHTKVPVKQAAVDVRPPTKLEKPTPQNNLSGLNTPNLSPTTSDPLSNPPPCNKPDSPDHSLPQTPSPILSPSPPTGANEIRWMSPFHRLYAYSAHADGCINVSIELDALQKLCDSWDDQNASSDYIKNLKNIISKHVAALIQSIALDATDHKDFEIMMDIRAEMILYLEHNYHWSTMSGRFAGYFNFASFVQLVTDAQQSIQEPADVANKVSHADQQPKMKRPGKRRSLREDNDGGSSEDYDESGEDFAKRKRQQSITALQERLHKMKVEIEKGGLVRLHSSEEDDHS